MGSLVVVCGLPGCGVWTPWLWCVDSLAVVCGLSGCGSQGPACVLSHCGAWAQLLPGMWDLSFLTWNGSNLCPLHDNLDSSQLDHQGSSAI